MTIEPEEKDYIAQVCAEDDAARRPRNRRVTAELVPPPGVICDEVAPITEQTWRSLDSPPAGGEVEIRAWRLKTGNSSSVFIFKQDATGSKDYWLSKFPNGEVDEPEPLVSFRDYRAHVTRLTAENARLREAKVLVEIAATSVVDAKISVEKERDSLKAEVERLTRKCHNADVALEAETRNKHALQSELTKALEFIEYVRSVPSSYFQDRLAEYLANQSAPAAKDSSDE